MNLILIIAIVASITLSYIAGYLRGYRSANYHTGVLTGKDAKRFNDKADKNVADMYKRKTEREKQQ